MFSNAGVLLLGRVQGEKVRRGGGRGGGRAFLFRIRSGPVRGRRERQNTEIALGRFQTRVAALIGDCCCLVAPSVLPLTLAASPHCLEWEHARLVHTAAAPSHSIPILNFTSHCVPRHHPTTATSPLARNSHDPADQSARDNRNNP